nr:ribonuclease H-like domain-containing protein [Tanacetum cinerariifolium]
DTSSGKGEINTASVLTASTQVSPACVDVAAASISHDTMDIKWNMALLSIMADRFWKKSGKKITIQGTDVAGFDKSKVECFNCHKMGHFAKESRSPRSQDRGRRENYKQGSKEEEPNPKALMAIDGIGWDWSYMANEEENHSLVADDEALTEFSLMAKSSSRLPEFANDTITDYSMPSPSIESNTSDLQNSNSSIFERGESSESIMSKPMIKVVKAKQLGKDFLMKNKACFICGHFDHLAYDCGVWVEKGKSWPKNTFAFKNMTPRADLLKTGRTSIAVNRTNTNGAQPKRTFFAKTAHSYVGRPFQIKSAVKTQFRVPRVYTVTKKFPTVDLKFSTAKSTFTAGLGNKGKKNIDDKGYWDSGCSRYMTGNISYLSDYEPYDGGYVSFEQEGGKITGKGIIKTGKLEFENVYFMKDLKYNLFSVS